ncbi:MAG: protein tyrosine phosphatase [Planctomycetes bacterium]|nr:protein tyrosine phosphatase [Planctomycetota bacterium]
MDIHCHILPGLDDGARDWDETLAMARCAVAQGIRRVIATPHQSEQFPGVNRERILAKVSQALQRFQEASIPLEILPGADVRVTEHLVAKLARGEIVTLGNLGKHLLLELPAELTLPLHELFYELESRGVRSILSHPERNTALQADTALLGRLVNQGCLLQVTAGSFLGRFGRAACRTAFRLLRNGLVHIIASDAHNEQDRPFETAAAYARVVRAVGPEETDKKFSFTPALIAEGVEYEPQLVSW